MSLSARYLIAFLSGMMWALLCVAIGSCSAVCATGWEASASTGYTARFGAEQTGTATVSGGIGREACK